MRFVFCASEIYTDTKCVEFVGADATLECRQQIVEQIETGGSEQGAASDANAGANLKGIENIRLFTSTVPAVIVAHSACNKAAIAVAQQRQTEV